MREVDITLSEPIFVCPYCGSDYGGRIACCGEHHGHGMWAIDETEEMFVTYADAEAFQEQLIEAAIAKEPK